MPVREVPATAAAFLVACVVEVGLRTLPLPRLARLMGAPLRADACAPAGLRAPQLGPRGRLQARAVRRVMRHWPFPSSCLRHALIAGHRLRRHHPRLVVGVARVEGAVKAHAWLEIGSGIFDPLGAAQGYLPLDSSAAVERA